MGALARGSAAPCTRQLTVGREPRGLETAAARFGLGSLDALTAPRISARPSPNAVKRATAMRAFSRIVRREGRQVKAIKPKAPVEVTAQTVVFPRGPGALRVDHESWARVRRA